MHSRRSRLFVGFAAAITAAAGLLVPSAGQAVAAPAPARVAPASTSSAACPWVGSTAPVAQRTAQVVSKMTLDEKITMVHGATYTPYTGYIPGDKRLCIPALKMQDGPAGVRLAGTTQLPSGTAVAASFDPSVAKSFGSLIGAEDKTKGVDVDLGPTINVVRDPRWGRAFESFGEDPYLAGQIGAADVQGIQDQGVMAQVKHLAVYNQEANRNTESDNAIVSDRAVHEIYTSAFDTVVSKSNPASAMCSYSAVNGAFACENTYLDNIMKNEFGFKGFIVSDWGGTHSTVASANAGLDVEMPDGTYFGPALKAAVQAGQVAQSRVDDMVSRILAQEFRFGLFEHPSPDTADATASTPAHVATALSTAEQGTVLLKNANKVLPLSSSTTHSIAVIGDGAGIDTLTNGGGSAQINGTGIITPYQGIKARAGSSATVTYSQGNVGGPTGYPIDSTYFTPPSGTGHGLQGDYYADTTKDTPLTGTPTASRIDQQVKFAWNGAAPAPGVAGANFSTKWTGTLTPPVSGTYTFGLGSDDGSRLLINGQAVVDNWNYQQYTTKTGQVTLTAGQPVQIEADFFQGTGDASVNLGWLLPNQDLAGDAAAAAAKADVAVVYANLNESEGSDLSNIDLPADQNALIEKVAAANPNTIVVLNTGSAVTMPWLDKVAGVFEAWYPGQQAGNAIAALLYGDVNPSGKLPVTFPKSLGQVPAATDAQWPGTNGTVQYSEGINVGYRHYDAKNLTPLYPFGYGLSYTNFAFSNVRVSQTSLSENGHLSVTADVTNTGQRAGADVAQLYLSDPASTAEPPKQLKGFQKVYLQPGQTRKVTFTISAKDASYWSGAHKWSLGAGTYRVLVGDSSRSVPLAGTFEVTHTSGPESTTVSAPSVVKPATTVTVRTAFANGATQPVRHAVTALTLPAGWSATATSASTFDTVAPGQSVGTSWQVTVPASATGGKATLLATTLYQGEDAHPSTDSTTTQVAYAGLSDAFNGIGITDDANPSVGNLDGAGNSISFQGLAAAGVTPGSTLTSGGANFTWPNVPAGTNDMVTTASQIVAMSGSGTSLSVLGTANNGDATGTITVTYTDGTTSDASLSYADWYGAHPLTGTTLAVSTHWNKRSADVGGDPNQIVGVYAANLPITAGKQISYLTLPTNGRMHIFDIVTQ
ncbi:glycoside hydrolase family 3 C-terminal domain-containing protein [Pengzhenrongella sp.]|jgi:beta-glucosidase|uniref:glycoside hydrolase family 3 C-terminal domain-containing protein n=1 Tax=Pengzhenrongella sp. TaxID=2888820 RepID=UPI002F939CA5